MLRILRMGGGQSRSEETPTTTTTVPPIPPSKPINATRCKSTGSVEQTSERKSLAKPAKAARCKSSGAAVEQNNNNNKKNKKKKRNSILGKSKDKEKEKDDGNIPRVTSFHENLVRQRDQHTGWEQIYDVIDEIGHSGFGICNVYKIRKKEGSIGGSVHKHNVRLTKDDLADINKRRSSASRAAKQFTRLLLRGRSSSTASSSPSSDTTPRKESSKGLNISDKSIPLIPEIPRPEPQDRLSSSTSSKVRFGDNDEITEAQLEEYDTENENEMDKNNPMARCGEIVFALKMINLALVPPDRIDQLKNEVEILKSLDHKHIIKAYETFPIKADKKLCIVMELCTGGDLHARLPYTEHQAAVVTRQIISALSYIHDRNIIHRDLKFENIVFESTHPDALIKVLDFGLSKKYSMDNPVLTERVGTLYSMSPETMQGIYTTKADIWSIGVCAFMLLANGEKPFEGKTPKQVVAKVLVGDYKFENNEMTNWDGISDDAKRFINDLLQVDPKDRLTAHEAKAHSWFSERNGYGRQRTKSKIELFQRVQESIIRYANTSEFRKLALNIIAKKSTSDEIFELRKIFDEFDTLNTGTITLGEFKDALVTRFNSSKEYTDAEIEQIFHKVDVNRNNEINYTEFLAAALETQGAISETRLAEAFDLMDNDDTGYISRENLRDMLGKHSDESYLDQLMSEADILRDGKISYEEFLQVLSDQTRRSVSDFYDVSESQVVEIMEPAGDNGENKEELLSVPSQEEASADEVLRKFGLVKTFKSISFSPRPRSSSSGSVGKEYSPNSGLRKKLSGSGLLSSSNTSSLKSSGGVGYKKLKDLPVGSSDDDDVGAENKQLDGNSER